VDQKQTFYDISLVDGYNVPMSLVYVPAENTTFIPPNLTNCACIATPGWLWSPAKSGVVYTNSSYPIPWESATTNDPLRNWCPWDLLAFPPEKPGDGVYPYPDDDVYRPDFSPCKSQCAATGSAQDCCLEQWHDPNKCKPSLYSQQAKQVCPDAYSFAFDDQSSTFIVPKGGGWKVIFCPEGRSTNILRTLGPQMFELASSGRLSNNSIKLIKNATYIESIPSSAGGLVPVLGFMILAAVLSAFSVMW
jgi:hypothetical protein